MHSKRLLACQCCRPNQRRPSSAQGEATNPCGKSCYMLHPKQAATTSPAVASCRDGAQQATNSSQHPRAKPSGPASDQAVPTSPTSAGAVPNSPALARPAPSSPLSAGPAASSSKKSSSKEPALTDSVWHSLQAFMQGHLMGGRKRTHSQAFEEPQATADTAANIGTAAEPSQHAKSGKRLPPTSPTRAHKSAHTITMRPGEMAMNTAAANTGVVDLTMTSSDSDAKRASHSSMPSAQPLDSKSSPLFLSAASSPQGMKTSPHSSKKKHERRASGCGSDPIEIDFTTSEDTGRPGHNQASGRPGHGVPTGRPGHSEAADRPGHSEAAGRPGHCRMSDKALQSDGDAAECSLKHESARHPESLDIHPQDLAPDGPENATAMSAARLGELTQTSVSMHTMLFWQVVW